MALFDILPPDLFKPLASPSRAFYADLLLSLHERTFSTSAYAPRRGDVLYEIGAFLSRWEQTNGRLKDEEASTSIDDRARAVYQRLVDTGWMIESRDRYIRLVDLDPDASGLLHVLATITRGESRTYGGAVVGVLSALENAAQNPQERSENVRNALRGAREFATHMRIVSVSLRKLEDYILRRESLHDIFKAFFEDFVQRHLITDFKSLHTKTNPFRFRSSIIHQAQKMSGSGLLIYALGEAYVREGRAHNQTEGERAVLSDLSDIIAVFDSTEVHLAVIDGTVASIEKRILNTARYMDRVGRNSGARLIETMKALVASPHGRNGISLSPALLPSSLPIGPAHIPTPRRERLPVEVGTIREVPRDPAFEAFVSAKAEYVRRTRVTPKGFLEFIARVMGGERSVRGRDIRVETVDDFVHFQRLREIPCIFDGAVSLRYEIEFLPERLKNPWIECQDFVIRPRKTGNVRQKNAA